MITYNHIMKMYQKIRLKAKEVLEVAGLSAPSPWRAVFTPGQRLEDDGGSEDRSVKRSQKISSDSSRT